MRVWATSDIHVDFPENLEWFNHLSAQDYTEDILIIAGDVIHDPEILITVFRGLVKKFSKVLFVPGNHDLWLWHGHKQRATPVRLPPRLPRQWLQ